MIRPYVSDWKPKERVRDPLLLRSLHLEWRECALCHATGHLSLHHISKHPRDDERGNLVMLDGSGTTGCHGKIEAGDEETMRALGRHVITSRGDVIAYLYERHGAIAAQSFLRNRLLLDSG